MALALAECAARYYEVHSFSRSNFSRVEVEKLLKDILGIEKAGLRLPR